MCDEKTVEVLACACTRDDVFMCAIVAGEGGGDGVGLIADDSREGAVALMWVEIGMMLNTEAAVLLKMFMMFRMRFWK